METRKPIRVLVCSPHDVIQERTIALRVLNRLRQTFAGYGTIEPILWEYEPLLATQPFQPQIARPSDTDITVIILWSRLGTPLSADITRKDGSRYKSGVEFELEDAIAGYRENGRPEILVYRKTTPPHFEDLDDAAHAEALEQKQAVDQFMDGWFKNASDASYTGAFHLFDAPDEFENKLEIHLQKRVERLLDCGPNEQMGRPVWTEGSPFRGLQPFHMRHAPVFFGRTKAVSEVVDALHRQHRKNRDFVMIIGASGAGKSSLVKAGVLPMLTTPGVIENAHDWRIAEMRPSANDFSPIDALAGSLLAEGALPELAREGSAAELAGLLTASPDQAVEHITDTLSRLPAGPVHLVIHVDQLEELFHEKIAKETQSAFCNILDTAAACGRITILTTLRSDFYPMVLESAELAALKAGPGQYDLPAPSPSEIGDMIRRPAIAAGLSYEWDPDTGERLDDILRDAASASPESLSLLQFTLEELYERREQSAHSGRLLLAAYREMGGMEGAIASRAEAVFTQLPDSDQHAFHNVFRQLLTISPEDGRGTRTYAALSNFPVGSEGAAFIRAFIDARLFVADTDSDGNRLVTVAHEALLAHWPRLVQWIEKNRENLRILGRVKAAAMHWEENQKPDDLLLTPGKPLAEALDILPELSGSDATELADFIKISRKKAEAQEQRGRRRLLTTICIVLALLVMAIGGLVTTLRQNRIVVQQTKAAEANATLAATSQEAAQANAALAETNAQKARASEAKAKLNERAAKENEQLAQLNARKAEESADMARKAMLKAQAETRDARNKLGAMLLEKSALVKKQGYDAIAVAYRLLAAKELGERMDLARAYGTFITANCFWRGLTRPVKNITNPMLEFSPYDNTFAYWDSDTLRMMSISKTGKVQERYIPLSYAKCRGFAFLPEGKIAILDNTFIRFFDISHLKQTGKIPHKSYLGNKYCRLAFSDKLNLLFLLSSDGVIKVYWPNRQKDFTLPFNLSDVLLINGKPIEEVYLSEDRLGVKSGSSFWDLKVNVEGDRGAVSLKVLNKNKTTPKAYAFEHGSWFFYWPTQGLVRRSDQYPRLSEIRREAGDLKLENFHFAQDSDRIVCSSAKGLRLLDKNNRYTPTIIHQNDLGYRATAISPDGKWVAAISYRKQLELWGQFNAVFADEKSGFAERASSYLADKIRSLTLQHVVHSPSEFLAIRFAHDDYSLLNTSSWATYPFREMPEFPEPVFDKTGKRLFWMRGDTLYTRQAKRYINTPGKKITGKAILRLNAPEAIYAIGVTRTNNPAILYFRDHKVRLHEQGKKERILSLDEFHPHCSVFSPTGSAAAIESGDGEVLLYDVNRGRHGATLFSESYAQFDKLAYSPNGDYLAGIQDDSTVTIWDTQSGDRVATWNRSEDTGRSSFSDKGISFFPDGRHVMVYDNYSMEILDTSIIRDGIDKAMHDFLEKEQLTIDGLTVRPKAESSGR